MTGTSLYTMVMKTVCAWISRGFVGFLHIKELLFLWDKILVVDDLYLLVILAVRYLVSLPWDRLWGRPGMSERDLKVNIARLVNIYIE